MEVLPKAHLEQGNTPLMLPKSSNSSTSSSTSGDEGMCAVLLTQKIKSLDLQDNEANDNNSTKHSVLETSCLLTPPNTPLSSEQTESETKFQEMEPNHHSDTAMQEEGERQNIHSG